MPENKPHDARNTKFVTEGVTDLTSQHEREQLEQSNYETELKKKERKSLQEQLKSNAISKQQEFNRLIQERNSFNRMSKEEIEFYESVETKEKERKQELEEYLERSSKDFDKKRGLLRKKDSKSTDETEIKIPKTVRVKGSKPRQSDLGIVKKKKKKVPKLKGISKS